MTAASKNGEEMISFELEVLDKSLSEDDLMNSLEKVIAETREELELPEAALYAELEGHFLGIGSVTAVVILKQMAISALVAAAAGLGKKTSEYVFDEYIAPKLRRRNLIPKSTEIDPKP